MLDKEEQKLVVQQEIISSDPEIAARQSDLIGTVIDNHYKILSVIGVGGMGTVYEAEDILLHRLAAIKIMNAGLLNSSQSVMRFQREATALGQLDHNNIVRVTDFGVHDDVMPFMAMQYVAGVPLSSVLQRGSLNISDTMKIALQLCNALEHAHANNIVHRDLKPSNILVDDELNFAVKIIDFGIAAFADENQVRLTKTGEVFGSPLYMSPEQCSGHKADVRSDLYALGCILYECLTGTPPIVGDTALVTMLKHQQETPLPLKQASLGKEFPADLERIIARTLEKLPEKRYQSASALRHDLQTFQSGKSVFATNDQPTTAGRQATNKFLIPAIGAAMVALIVAVGLIVYQSLSHQTTLTPKVPENITMPSLDTIAPDFELDAIERAQPEVLHCQVRAVTREGIGDAEMSRIAKIASIRCLDFNGVEKISGKGLAEAADMTNLVELRLSRTSIRPADLINLNPRLKSLTLSSNTNITDDAVRNLTRLRHLERLSLSNTKISDRSLSILKSFPKLRFLDLHNCEVHQDALERFLQECPHCLVLTSSITLGAEPPPNDPAISFASHSSLKNLAQTAKAHKIEHLDLSHSELKDSDAAMIAKLPLRYLNINHCQNVTSAGISKLLTCKTLLRFDAVGTAFDSQNCAAVDQRMQELDLGYSHVDDKGVRILSTLKHLTFLDLRHNPISDECLSYLGTTPSLSYLNTTGTDFDKQAVEKFKREQPDCLLVSQ